MKGIFLAFTAILASALMIKADFRIVFLNTPTVSVNGKEMKVNDVFPEKSAIKWSSPKQAMKIVDTQSGKQRLIVAEQYQKSKAADVMSFIKGVKHLSSRGSANNVVTLRNMMTDHFYFTDSISFTTDFKTDRDHFFFVSYEYEGEEINKRIHNHNGTFSISGDIFTIDGKQIPQFDVILSLHYLDLKANKSTLITDGMYVTMIPEELSD
ncbi:MAG: hypothetical protein K2H72_02650 [Muribaculaceae bacterium]|nr:hypothetical protein [Muribaculaceae bacterium]